MTAHIRPYRGSLNLLLVGSEQAESLKSESGAFTAITLTARQQCDLELLINGALSPLEGFMGEKDYYSTLRHGRLSDGTLWPIPYYLDVSRDVADGLKKGDMLALRDTEGFMPAVLCVEDIWEPDKEEEALSVYGTADTNHPGVDYLYTQVNDIYVGGKILGIQLPFHYDFEKLRDTPASLREYFDMQGWRNVVAFHTSKPMHKVHQEITIRAAREAEAHILIHPVVGLSKPGDIQYHARVHCYQKIVQHYPKGLVALSLLPAAMRMAGPREALMNAIIRQNYGCSHFIVGSEHAAPPGVRDSGRRFYDSGASQEYVLSHADELDISIIGTPELAYDEGSGKFIEQADADHDHVVPIRSNQQIVRDIQLDKPVPEWMSWPDVIAEIRKACPPRCEQGITLFFTGLSGSGKSTLANILYAKFIEDGRRPVSLLDGDIVRHNLSSELGFTRRDRNINVNRIGFVASEITKNKGIAICAPIAPYADVRRNVRANIEQYGAFIEIHVATPLEVCESRDRKGLYAKARKGIIPEFTGISDPYEVPENPELCINTENVTPLEAVQEVYLYLIREGYICAK